MNPLDVNLSSAPSLLPETDSPWSVVDGFAVRWYEDDFHVPVARLVRKARKDVACHVERLAREAGIEDFVATELRKAR